MDVMLKRLRERYPRAILVYVDLASLFAWRKPTGKPQRFEWSAMWEAAPTCTTQLQTWLEQTGTEWWSMRQELKRNKVLNTAILQ